MGKHTTSQNTEFQNKLDDDPLSPIESISENNEEIETFEKYNSMDDIDDSPSEDKNSEIEIENLLQKIADDESDSLIYTDNDITDTIGTDEETETDLLQSILGNEDEDEHDQSPQVDISNLLTGLDNDTIETADAIHDEAETDLLQNILGDEYQDDQPPKADDNISLTDNDITDTVETDNETDLLQSILGNKDEDEHDQSPQVDISSLLTGLDNDTLEAADAIHDEAETDLLQNILGDEYQDDQPPKANDNISLTDTDSDITDTLEPDNAINDIAEIDLLHSILGDKNDQPSQADFSDLQAGTDKEETIEPGDASEYIDDETNLLQNILGDEYQANQPSQNDNSNSLSNATKEFNEAINDDGDIEDLLKSILGEQYKNTQILLNNEESMGLSQAKDITGNPLDQKIFTFENLWNELSTTWPAIYNHPEIKIKIEELWESLKKDNSFLPYLSQNIPSNTLSDNPVDIEDEVFGTSLDELSHIQEYDIKSDIADTYDEKDSDEPVEADNIISSVDEILSGLSYEPAPLTDTIHDDFETADDDIYSESIDSLDKEKIALNLPADEPTSSINLEELGITDLYSDDSTEDSTKGSDFELLNSILSKAEESDDTQKYSSEEAIDTNDTDEVLDSLLSKVEIADDEILDSILDETPEPVTDRPITTEAIRTVETKKYDDKTYPSKAASPDYSAALKKNIRYVSHDINKLPTKIETRKSGSFLAIAATVAIIAIATWIYFKEDKIKTKSIPTNIIKYDQTRSPIAQDEKIISAQDHSEDTYDSKIIDTETTAQSRTEFSQPQHIETDYVSPVYPDTPEYIDDSAITDIETATQTSTEPSPPQDIEADYVSPVYPDTSESIDDSAMTDIETPAQTSTEPSPPQDIEADYAGPDYPDSSIYTDDSIVSTPPRIEIDEAEQIKAQPETTKAVDENSTQSETVLIEPVISDQVISTKSKSQSWALNLSSIFATRKPAEEIVNLLHSKNIPAEIKEITINGKVWNRIRIRGFDSKQDALDYMKVIRQHTDIKKYWINRLHTQPEQ